MGDKHRTISVQEGCIQGHSCWLRGTSPAPEASMEDWPSHCPQVNKSCPVGSVALKGPGSELANLSLYGWASSGLHDLRHLLIRLKFGKYVSPHSLPIIQLLARSPCPESHLVPPDKYPHDKGGTSLLRVRGLQAKDDAASSAHAAPGWLCLQ